MRKSTITVKLPYPIKDIWQIVTDLEHYHWRTDVEKLEILENKTQFMEYPQKGQPIQFTITRMEPYQYYAFDMKHALFRGKWLGIFSEINEDETEIIFSEQIFFYKKRMQFLSYFMMSLKKLQKRYFKDLLKALEQQKNGQQ